MKSRVSCILATACLTGLYCSLVFAEKATLIDPYWALSSSEIDTNVLFKGITIDDHLYAVKGRIDTDSAACDELTLIQFEEPVLIVSPVMRERRSNDAVDTEDLGEELILPGILSWGDIASDLGKGRIERHQDIYFLTGILSQEGFINLDLLRNSWMDSMIITSALDGFPIIPTDIPDELSRRGAPKSIPTASEQTAGLLGELDKITPHEERSAGWVCWMSFIGGSAIPSTESRLDSRLYEIQGRFVELAFKIANGQDKVAFEGDVDKKYYEKLRARVPEVVRSAINKILSKNNTHAEKATMVLLLLEESEDHGKYKACVDLIKRCPEISKEPFFKDLYEYLKDVITRVTPKLMEEGFGILAAYCRPQDVIPLSGTALDLTGNSKQLCNIYKVFVNSAHERKMLYFQTAWLGRAIQKLEGGDKLDLIKHYCQFYEGERFKDLMEIPKQIKDLGKCEDARGEVFACFLRNVKSDDECSKRILADVDSQRYILALIYDSEQEYGIKRFEEYCRVYRGRDLMPLIQCLSKIGDFSRVKMDMSFNLSGADRRAQESICESAYSELIQCAKRNNVMTSTYSTLKKRINLIFSNEARERLLGELDTALVSL